MSDLRLPYRGEINTEGNAFEIIQIRSGGVAIHAASYGLGNVDQGNPNGYPGTAIVCDVDSGGIGLHAFTVGRGSRGVLGMGDYGVVGSGDTAGVVGQSFVEGGYAGLFFGPVVIDGNSKNNGSFNNGNDTGNGLFFGYQSGEGIASTRIRNPNNSGNLYGLDFYTRFTSRLSIDHNGNISVNGGNINLRGSGDITLANSDCAEDFDISQDHDVDPGTVMVLNEKGSLEPSQQSYDKKVAGVISGAGNYKPGIVLGRQQSDNKRKPIALVGKVYCKVDATLSTIQIGDLLTTSSTAGHAMKVEDQFKAFGAVLGKALGSIKEGLGMIPVLVALQ